jgi:hypothetical protein
MSALVSSLIAQKGRQQFLPQVSPKRKAKICKHFPQHQMTVGIFLLGIAKSNLRGVFRAIPSFAGKNCLKRKLFLTAGLVLLLA